MSKFSYPAFFAVLAAALSGLSAGLDVGMISSTIAQPSFLEYFKNPGAAKIGGIVSSFSAGATIGAFGCSLIVDRFGRVKGLLSGALVVILGVALQAGAVSVGMLIAGRTITGLGAGQLTAVLPVYATELSPPAVRGALGSLQMLGIELAIFLATAIGYAFGTHYKGNVQWRAPLGLQALPVVLLVIVCFFLPESPRFLLTKGREEDAMRVLTYLHRAQGHDFIQGEFQEIKDQIEAEKKHREPTWKEIATRASWRKRVILSSVLQWLAQLTGINCIQYFYATIIQSLGFSTSDSLMLNMIYGASGLVFTIFWLSFIDKLGRKPALIISSLGMAVALTIQAVLSQIYTVKAAQGIHVPANALRAQIMCFFLFNLFFVCLGALAWYIPAEIMPVSIRAKGTSIAVAHNNIGGIVVAQVAPIALGKIGFKFFWVFVAFDVIGAITYAVFFPETSKLTLEQMDILFGDQLVPHALAEPEARRPETSDMWVDSTTKEA
ncbi:general substrate transporter [Meredithblackwellia eburnea MCA 4105]